MEWTIVHSFYAGMGGFVFDVHALNAEGDEFLPGPGRLHITPRGVQLLAKCDLLPSIPKREITDKNKTDMTAKVICCFQVGWILVQALARVSLGLAVTPLETNTIGHVLCALINYALWWHKPKWIREPTVIAGPWARSLCAFMYMSSQISSEDWMEDRSFLRDFGVQTEISNMVYVPPVAKASSDTSKPPSSLRAQPNPGGAGRKARHGIAPLAVPDRGPPDGTPSVGTLVPRQYPSGEPSPNKGAPPSPSALVTNSLAPTHLEMARRRLACEAMAAYLAVRERLEPAESNKDEARYREALRLYPEMPQKVKLHFKRTDKTIPGRPALEEVPGSVCVSEELVVERPKNWPGDDLMRDMQGHLMGIVLWTVTILYGAVHLAGWNEQFPTSMEQWFWRGSAAYLVFSGLLWSLLNLMGHLSGGVWWFWYDMLAGHGSPRAYFTLLVLCCIGGSLYVVARVFLVVEAFVSLRALPASAYQSPSWILTVPHL